MTSWWRSFSLGHEHDPGLTAFDALCVVLFAVLAGFCFGGLVTVALALAP